MNGRKEGVRKLTKGGGGKNPIFFQATTLHFTYLTETSGVKVLGSSDKYGCHWFRTFISHVSFGKDIQCRGGL